MVALEVQGGSVSGAIAYLGSTMAAFLKTLGGEMGLVIELGKAEDDRLKQPARVTWVPVKNSGQVRECADPGSYPDGRVIWERSNAWTVNLRGKDEADARYLEQLLFNGLVTIGATSVTTDITSGDVDPFSVVAEQGYLIAWQVRVWEPIYYERFTQGHIETTVTSVDVTDSLGNEAGSIT